MGGEGGRCAAARARSEKNCRHPFQFPCLPPSRTKPEPRAPTRGRAGAGRGREGAQIARACRLFFFGFGFPPTPPPPLPPRRKRTSPPPRSAPSCWASSCSWWWGLVRGKGERERGGREITKKKTGSHPQSHQRAHTLSFPPPPSPPPSPAADHPHRHQRQPVLRGESEGRWHPIRERERESHTQKLTPPASRPARPQSRACKSPKKNTVRVPHGREREGRMEDDKTNKGVAVSLF